MSDPGSSLRATILGQREFDLRQIRALCIQITAGMADIEMAQQLQQDVVDEVALLEQTLTLTARGFAHAGDLRRPALAAVARLERSAC